VIWVPEERRIQIPRLLHVSATGLSDVGQLLVAHGFEVTKVLVAMGAGPTQAPAARVIQALEAQAIATVTRDGLCGRLEQAAALAATIIGEQVTTVIAVGGGRVIDTAKLAAARTRVPFVSVPTAIAHDGISSPVASLTQQDGVRRSFAAEMPSGVVVDVPTIAASPRRTLQAGLGDLVSNLTATMDWQLASQRGLESFDAFSAMIAESAARPALRVDDLGDPAVQEQLAKGLLLSGLAMAAAGSSRPCSGAEHLISHALDALLGESNALHGEQVALGTLVSAAAHDRALLEELWELFDRVGLPTDPEHLEIRPATMRSAIQRAAATRPDRWTVLSDLDLSDTAVDALTGTAFRLRPLARVRRV
jgi:glycerol-1-phosphate dehydrogenase [NAD(P)+]